MIVQYAIKKDNKYLSELFPIAFKTRDISKAYIYNVKQIAQDIATKEGAVIVAIR